MLTEPPAAPAQTHGRAGRNLPAAIGIGVGLGAYVVLSLIYLKPAFVVLVAVALVLAAVELHEALKKQGMTSTIIPIAIGSVAIAFGSYFAGRQVPVDFSTPSVLLGVASPDRAREPDLADAKRGSRICTRRRGQPVDHCLCAVARFIRSVDARRRTRRCTHRDLPARCGHERHGRLCRGSAFGKHPMAPKISPKKSWEGLGGSLVFATAAGICMAIFVLDVPFWVGIILGVSLVVVGTCGDLIESMIKRDLGIKT